MRLRQKVNGILTATVFEADSLYFEQSTAHNADACLDDDPISFIQSHTIQWSGYQVDIDYQMAVGAGIKYETTQLYGMPERESNPVLNSTFTKDPYRFFNIDYYMHQKDDPRGQYGSVPYVTGHAKNFDVGLLWVNSADTWVDTGNLSGSQAYTGFVSQSGVLEFFMIATAQSPKKLLKDLTTITGHAELPPIYSLGFHFSKYAQVTSDIMIQRDSDFESHGFPVDVYWMDILYAPKYEYFIFDKKKFGSIDTMN